MNKTELIKAVSERTKLSQTQAGVAVDALTEVISDAIAQGDSVNLVGFGAFTRKWRAARTARNPRTGESVTVEGHYTPGFKPGKPFKDAVR